jgi:phosphatidylinositol-3-phosphatase
VNLSYELCETYPSLLVVPKKATDELIKKAAAFRSK